METPENIRRLPVTAIAGEIDVYERCNYRCVICGATEKLHVDHVRPRSEGGADAVYNYSLLCEKHNLEKSDKVLPNFIWAHCRNVSKQFPEYVLETIEWLLRFEGGVIKTQPVTMMNAGEMPSFFTERVYSSNGLCQAYAGKAIWKSDAQCRRLWFKILPEYPRETSKCPSISEFKQRLFSLGLGTNMANTFVDNARVYWGHLRRDDFKKLVLTAEGLAIQAQVISLTNNN